MKEIKTEKIYPNDFSIIARASKGFDLSVLESLLIARGQPSLNFQQLSIPLCL